MIDLSTVPITLIICDSYGVAVAKRLADEGLDLTICSIQDKAADKIVDAGMAVTSSVAASCANAQVIITLLAYLDDVETVYLDSDGIISRAAPGSYLIDMSTATGKQARELYAIAAVNDLHFLDCPYVGTVEQAEEGRLTCFVGGERSDLEVARPLLDLLCESVSYHGIAGSGQVARLAVQTMLASAMIGAAEAFALADVYKLDRSTLLDVIRDSDLRDTVLDELLPKALARDFEAGYPVSYLFRDIAAALESADDQALTLPLMETAYQICDLLSVVGGSTKGIQGLTLVYDEEDRCLEEGLDWSKADNLPYDDGYGYDDEGFGMDDHFHDHGHDHFHDHDHHHDHFHDHGEGFGPDNRRRGDMPPFGSGMFFSDN